MILVENRFFLMISSCEVRRNRSSLRLDFLGHLSFAFSSFSFYVKKYFVLNFHCPIRQTTCLKSFAKC